MRPSNRRDATGPENRPDFCGWCGEDWDDGHLLCVPGLEDPEYVVVLDFATGRVIDTRLMP